MQERGENKGLPKREESWMLKFRKRVGTWIIKMACNRYSQKLRNFLSFPPQKQKLKYYNFKEMEYNKHILKIVKQVFYLRNSSVQNFNNSLLYDQKEKKNKNSLQAC